MPDTRGSFFDYVTVIETDCAHTGMRTAAHAQIKPEVLQAMDWSWLPTTEVGGRRDNRLLRMAAVVIFRTETMKAIGNHLAKSFAEFTQKFNIRVNTIGGTEWMLDEPSIYSLYQRICTTANEENRNNSVGLWTVPSGTMPSSTELVQAHNRLKKAAQYYINLRDGVIPPPSTDMIDEQEFPRAAQLLREFDDTVRDQSLRNSHQ